MTLTPENIGTIIGATAVIIGALIGSLVPLFGIIIESQKWRKDQKIQQLKMQKETLQKNFAETRSKILKGLKGNKYDLSILTDFLYLFPEEVRCAFDELIKENPKTEGSKTKHLIKIDAAMKKSLQNIDLRIEEEINKKIFSIF